MVTQEQETAATAPDGTDVKGSQANQPAPGTHAEHIRESLDILYERYPKAFIREGEIKPLKIGILEDLKADVPKMEGMSVSKLRGAVRLYTTRLRYLYGVKEGNMRIDLEGNPTEAVTPEHEAYAKERFLEISQKRKEAREKRQKQLERQQQLQKRKDAQRKKKFNKGGRPFNNKFQNRGPQGEGGQSVRKPAVKFASSRFKKDFKPRTAPQVSNDPIIPKGTAVQVSAGSKFVKGTVEGNDRPGMVKVKLESGMTLVLPISRISIPEAK